MSDLYAFASSNDENNSVVMGVTLCGPIFNHTDAIEDWESEFFGALCIDLSA